MDRFTAFIKNMFDKKNCGKRIALCFAAVIMMGFCLSWLVLVDMGTDPYTSMNRAIASIIGTSVGTWQLTLNCLLFIIVIIWGRYMIGVGTLVNMTLVAYSLDFFSWIWGMVLPEGLFDSMAVRIAVLIPALVVFVFSVGVYIDVQMGTAPYDALTDIVCKHQKKIPYRVVRMMFDLSVLVIAYFLGAKIGIVTIVMGFTLGPVISAVGKLVAPLVGVDEEG